MHFYMSILTIEIDFEHTIIFHKHLTQLLYTLSIHAIIIILNLFELNEEINLCVPSNQFIRYTLWRLTKHICSSRIELRHYRKMLIYPYLKCKSNKLSLVLNCVNLCLFINSLQLSGVFLFSDKNVLNANVPK